jgi:hypothetical protein
MAERIAELGIAVGVDVMAIGRAELGRPKASRAVVFAYSTKKRNVRGADRQGEIDAGAGEKVARPVVGLVLADRLAVDRGAPPPPQRWV